MAASSVGRTNGPCKMLGLVLLLIGSVLNAGVSAQDDFVTATVAPKDAEDFIDMLVRNAKDTESDHKNVQFQFIPTPGFTDTTVVTVEEPFITDGEEVRDSHVTVQEGSDEEYEKNVAVVTEETKVTEAETPVPAPPRGDGPNNIPQKKPVLRDDVVCVGKEAVQDKNGVNLKLKASSSCKDTKMKIESVIEELCGDCKLEIYQEDNTDEILVSGQYVEDDVARMTNKFNNDNIKDKTDVEEAVPHWGKNSKLVLVSLLLTGLLLAALLVAGYFLKTHRKNSKGVRLAESFQVDEENQANTLVSVAPLPQEPLDKPTINGESPPENGTNPAPTTNGHSATHTPMADTEM